MQEMKATLYQFWRSSASWRVRWALMIKGIPFDIVSVDLLAGRQNDTAYRACNPFGAVPTLVTEGRALGESVAILEYLEERIPDPPLYPREAWARARTRQFIELINSGTQPFQTGAVKQRHAADDPAEQDAWVRHFNERGLAACEQLATTIAAELGHPDAEGRFVMGAALTAADLFLVPQLHHARRFGANVSRYPRLLAAEQAALATPHAEAVRPERQPDAPR
ncbi:MAG TPA: maleylacetoacetate isomerase [Polyangia bacterium]|jgi:maleylacetoacetate isomerase|nr:maleylacetoacetate isomerase [Polyangia bacterium]